MTEPDELRDADDSPRPPRQGLRIGAIVIIVVALILAVVLPIVQVVGR
jgi:hypothetical protein